MKLKYDHLDKKILSILMNEARTTSQDIARECGISGAAVHHRLQKINKSGMIEGAHLKINPKTLGYETCAFVNLQISVADNNSHNALFEKIKAIPEIVECHHTTGKYSFLIKVYTTSNKALKDLIVEKIQTIPEVITTETLISLEEGFDRFLPV